MVCAPFAHYPERLLVEVDDGARGHAGAPEGFADVFDVACRDVREAHLGDRFLKSCRLFDWAHCSESFI